MNRSLKLLLIVGGFLFLVFLAIRPDNVSEDVQMVRDINREYPVTQRELNSVKDEDIINSAAFEEGFMEACIVDENMNARFCNCGLNHIRATLTNEDIIRYIELLHDEDPRAFDIVTPAFEACKYLL